MLKRPPPPISPRSTKDPATTSPDARPEHEPITADELRKLREAETSFRHDDDTETVEELQARLASLRAEDAKSRETVKPITRPKSKGSGRAKGPLVPS